MKLFDREEGTPKGKKGGILVIFAWMKKKKKTGISHNHS